MFPPPHAPPGFRGRAPAQTRVHHVVAPLLILAAAVGAATTQGLPALLFVVMAGLAIGELLAAGRHRHDLAGMLATLACAIVPWWGILSPNADFSGAIEVILLTLAILVAGLCLRTRWLLVAITVHVAITVLAMLLNPSIPTASAVQVGLGIALAGALVGGTSALREQASQESVAYAISRRLRRPRPVDPDQESARIDSETLRHVVQVTSVVAHEINNPLAVVKLCAQQLEDELDPNAPMGLEHLGLVAQLLQATEQCSSSIRALVELGDTSTVRARLIDLTDVIETAVRLVRGRPELLHVAVEVDVPADLPAIGDAHALAVGLTHILAHVGRQLPQGATLRIHLRRDADVAVLDIGEMPFGDVDATPLPALPVHDDGRTDLGLLAARLTLAEHGAELLQRVEGPRYCLTLYLPTHPTSQMVDEPRPAR